MGRFTRAFVGASLSFAIIYVLGLDSLLFLRHAEGTLIKVQSQTKSKRPKGNQLFEYTFLVPDIRYEYVVDGKKFVGDKFYLQCQGGDLQCHQGINSTEETQQLLSTLGVGQVHRVWYDARDPSVSWLKWHGVTIGGAILAIGFAIIALPINWRRRRGR